jgi:hypothetical protein
MGSELSDARLVAEPGEAPAEVRLVERGADLACEHEAGLVPQLAGLEQLFALAGGMKTGAWPPGRRRGAGFVVRSGFGFGAGARPVEAAHDGDDGVLQVDVVPAQPQCLAEAEPEFEERGVERAEARSVRAAASSR